MVLCVEPRSQWSCLQRCDLRCAVYTSHALSDPHILGSLVYSLGYDFKSLEALCAGTNELKATCCLIITRGTKLHANSPLRSVLHFNLSAEAWGWSVLVSAERPLETAQPVISNRTAWPAMGGRKE